MINKVLSILPIQKFTISGHSMEPTIRDGESVLVNRLAFLFRSPQKGDIVAAEVEGKIFIKRIASAKPGTGRNPAKQNTYFLAGDNPEDSFDSRKFGSLNKKQIVGKVMVY